MTIPNSQLQTWGNIGATDRPQRTYASIQTALNSFKGWPSDARYEVYLSGSYRNSTNIHAESDADVIVELSSVQYSNLTEAEKLTLKLGQATYSWQAFRQHVISALTNYYGAAYIDTSGKKAIKVLPAGGRQKADVIAAAKYVNYDNLSVRANGIIFWTQPGRVEIINYPKVHYQNGVYKNAEDKTRGWFKQSIRVHKNAREAIYRKKPNLNGKFPSYFIECLLYNVPDSKFGGTHQANFLDILNWLSPELYTDRANQMICQNGMYFLFRDTPVTWNIADARLYVSELIDLWNSW